MKLLNTSIDEDNILTKCEDFGGYAEESAKVAQRLDDELSNALSEIETLKNELRQK